MRRLRKSDWETETIIELETETIVGGGDPLPSRRSRFWGNLIMAVLWTLSGIFSAGFIYKGVRGLMTGQAREYSKHYGARMLYGDEARGYSWICIGIGTLCVGWILGHLTNRPIFKWILWLAAAAMFAAGIWLTIQHDLHDGLN